MYRIKFEDSQIKEIVTDSAQEAKEFVRQFSNLILLKRDMSGKFLPNKKEKRYKRKKQIAPWTKEEVRVILENSQLNPKELKEYIPNHTLDAISYTKSVLLNNKPYISEPLKRIAREIKSEIENESKSPSPSSYGRAKWVSSKNV